MAPGGGMKGEREGKGTKGEEDSKLPQRLDCKVRAASCEFNG